MGPLRSEGCGEVVSYRDVAVHEVEHRFTLLTLAPSEGRIAGGTVEAVHEGVRDMCCFAAAAALIGPRFGILVWWLVDSARWEAAFDNFWVSFIGFLFLPWTTIMYVATYVGGVNGFDWIWMGLGVLFDLASYSSGGFSGRSKYAN